MGRQIDQRSRSAVGNAHHRSEMRVEHFYGTLAYMQPTVDRPNIAAPVRTLARLAPSVLSADHAHLAEQVNLVHEYAEALHVDFMDGHFVPTLGFAPEVIRGLKGATQLPLRSHLMVCLPDQFIDTLADYGADVVTVHYECGDSARRAIERACERGVKAGLALKLDTPTSVIEACLDEIDSVLIMSIIPGWSGQSFKEEALPRIEEVRAMIDRHGLTIDVEVDGGVDETVAPRCVEAGATVLAAATAVFQAEDPAQAARRMAELCKRKP
jgi:ribulose-phosphate 3-epimerase